MNFLPHPELSTDGWAAKVHQHPLPDRKGIPAEEYGRRGKRWSQDPGLRPWFDQPNALETIAQLRDRGLVSDDEVKLLTQWVTEGYFIIEDSIDQRELIDQYANDLDGVWTAEQPLDGLQVSGVRVDGVKRNPIPHAELLSWPLDVRLHLRDTQTWRIHFYQPYTRAGLEMAKAAKLVRMSYLLLAQSPILLNLTAYKYSSEVALHQDLWFYHLHPPALVGVWLACQDVSLDNGPLAVYPGSHTKPVWPGFSNYPQTNYRTAHVEMYADVETHLWKEVAGINRIVLPVKKGDAIFLHGLIVHDAEKVTERGDRSRFSIVFHYSVPGANRMHEVEGPFNY